MDLHIAIYELRHCGKANSVFNKFQSVIKMLKQKATGELF